MDDKDAPVDVYVGPSWLAGQVQELLQNAGIDALLKDEEMGYLDAPAISAGAVGSVKVVVARGDVDRAEVVIRDFGGQNGLLEPQVEETTGPPIVPSWSCPGCSEQVEAQFGACWKCGAPRP